MIEPWVQILNKINLTPLEQGVLKRFEKSPTGRSFLPVSEILIKYEYVDEAIELLMQGVSRYPDYSVARVILSRELLKRGMAQEAWTILEESSLPLHDNVLAQKIKLQLAIVLDMEFAAREIYTNIKNRRIYDQETKGLGDRLEYGRFVEVRKQFIDHLIQGGYPLELYKEQGFRSAPLKKNVLIGQQWSDETVQEPPVGVDRALKSEIEGFHVTTLQGIFADINVIDRDLLPEGSEAKVDSLALAEIYEKQGCYQKAYEVYERMLKLTPKNDFLRRKLSEVARLRQEQRLYDRQVDPSFIDKIEKVEALDRKIRYLNRILERLDDNGKGYSST